MTNAVAGTTGTNLTNGAFLTVNLNGAYFNSGVSVSSLVPGIVGGSAQPQLFTLLHELAHLTGAAGFQEGDNTTALQNANNALLLATFRRKSHFSEKPLADWRRPTSG